MSGEPTKTCDGCGKDLSNDGAYPAGFDGNYGRRSVQLWRCAPCKIAKDTHRIAALERAISGSLNTLSDVSGNLTPKDEVRRFAAHLLHRIEELRRTLADAIQDCSYPSLGRREPVA